MTEMTLSAYADMKRKLGEAITAHQAIADGIADHAQKHEARIAGMRDQARHNQNIEAGIERSNNQV